MKTIDSLIATTFATADASDRCAAADAQFLAVFLSLKGEARAACWRGLDYASKYRLVARQLAAVTGDWMPSDVEGWIARYDEKWAAGPIDAAIEGALERLAADHAQYARSARAGGEKDDAKHFQRAANAYTKALLYYRNGVRPEQTARGWMLPSQRPGEPPHLLHMDGDWICTCAAGASLHWASALIIGIEVAMDAMQQEDDGACDPPGDNPLGDDEGDSLPSARQFGQRLCAARSRCYAEAA